MEYNHFVENIEMYIILTHTFIFLQPVHEVSLTLALAERISVMESQVTIFVDISFSN